jgi:hypothetical protein
MLFEPDHRHELLEQHVVRHADGDVAPVAGLEQLIRRGQAMAVAHRLRHLAGFEIFRRLPGGCGDRRLHQRNVGDAAFAGPSSAEQARERCVRREQGAEHISGLHPRPHRHLARLAGHRQNAGKRLDNEIDAGAPPVRSGLAEARNRGVDQLRVDLFQVFGSELEFFERIRPMSFQKNV